MIGLIGLLFSLVLIVYLLYLFTNKFKNMKQFIIGGVPSIFVLKEDYDKLKESFENSILEQSKRFSSEQNAVAQKLEAELFENQRKFQFLAQSIHNLQSEIVKLKEVQKPMVEVAKPQPTVQYPISFSSDSITSAQPLGFDLQKLDKTYLNGIFRINQISDLEAELTLSDDFDVVKRYLGSFDQLIKPVCEVEQSVITPTNIKVISKGVLKRENHVLKIVKKIYVTLS